MGRPYELRGGIVQDLRFSPDGRTLAVSGNAPPNARGVVDLIDPRTQERRVRIVPPRYPGPTPLLMANTRFLPNGRDVIVQQIPDLLDIDGAPSVLRRFDGETGAAMGTALRVGRHSSIGMWGTGDRSRLFVTSHADDETYMIDANRLELLQRWPAGDVAGTVSSDGSTFALGSQKGEVRLLDLRSGRVRRLQGSHDGSVVRMGFTRDGRTLVTSGVDAMLIVWDVSAREVRETLSGHANGWIWGLDVSAAGRTAYSAGEDGRSFVWDLAGDRRLVRPFAADRPFVPDDGNMLPRGLTLSPDGRTLALGNSDGTVDLIDTATLRPRATLQALHGFVGALAFSPDGRVLAAAGQRGEVALWDARTLRPRGGLTGLRTTSQTLAFSPDSRLLAAAELGDRSRDRRRGGLHRRGRASVGRATTGSHRRALQVVLSLDRVQPGRRAPRRGVHDDAHPDPRHPKRAARRAALHPRSRPVGGVLPRRRPPGHGALRRNRPALVDRELEAGRPTTRGS